MLGQSAQYLGTSHLEPDPRILTTLNELTKDERNTVFLISSATKDRMHQWYAEACPALGLAAENGFFWRPDSKDKNEHQWAKLLKITDL
jgi:trehalose-6-phosphatase